MAGTKRRPRSLNVGFSTYSESCGISVRNALRSPHHQLAIDGMANGAPSNALQIFGKKPRIAADSKKPVPGALASTTLPAR